MKQKIKKIVSFSLGPVISALIGFITVPVISNLIEADQYGLASMYTLLNNILTVIVLIGIDQAFMREFNEEEDKDKLFTNAITIPFIMTIIFGIILIIFKDFFANLIFDDKMQTLPIISLAICMPLFIIEKFFLLTIRMQEKGLKYSIWTIASKIFNLIFVIVLLLYYKKNFESVVYAGLLSQLLTSLLIFFTEYKNVKIHPKLIEKKKIIDLLKYGLPLLPTTVISWALNSMDMVFLRGISTLDEVGYYSVALKFVSIVQIVQTSFVVLWAPIAFKWNKNNVKKERFEFVSEIMSFVMIFIMIGIMIFKDIIPYIISSDYAKTIYILPFLLFYPIYYTISETVSIGISFSRKTYYNIIISIVSLFINLILNWLLIPKYNGVGAAIATGISYLTFFWCRTLISRKLWYKFPINKFVVISILSIIVALVNSCVKNIFVVEIINIFCLVIIVFLYRNLIKELKKWIVRKKVSI